MEIRYDSKDEDGEHVYQLSQKLTGQDYLEMQSTLFTPPVKLKRNGSEQEGEIEGEIEGELEVPEITDDVVTGYNHKVLMVRLKEWDWDKPINEENVRALPMSHYATLYQISVQFQRDEMGPMEDFLRNHSALSSLLGLQSTSEPSSDSPQSTSDPPSS